VSDDSSRRQRSDQTEGPDPPDDRRRATPAITPNLWFDDNGIEAAEFYVSVFPNSEITDITHYGGAGPGTPGAVLTVNFSLDGHPHGGEYLVDSRVVRQGHASVQVPQHPVGVDDGHTRGLQGVTGDPALLGLSP